RTEGNPIQAVFELPGDFFKSRRTGQIAIAKNDLNNALSTFLNLLNRLFEKVREGRRVVAVPDFKFDIIHMGQGVLDVLLNPYLNSVLAHVVLTRGSRESDFASCSNGLILKACGG